MALAFELNQLNSTHFTDYSEVFQEILLLQFTRNVHGTVEIWYHGKITIVAELMWNISATEKTVYSLR